MEKRARFACQHHYLQHMVLQMTERGAEYEALGREIYTWPYSLVWDSRVPKHVQGLANHSFYISATREMPAMITSLNNVNDALKGASNALFHINPHQQPDFHHAEEMFAKAAEGLRGAHMDMVWLRGTMDTYRQIQRDDFVANDLEPVRRNEAERTANRRAHAFDAWLAALPVLKRW